MLPRVTNLVSRHSAAVMGSALLLLVTVGCHNHPVRHLAGDVSQIKVGETTRQEAMAIMGEPNSKRQVSATAEEWLYQEEDKSVWQKAPVVGGAFSAQGYKTVALTVEGDRVTAARYGTYDKDEMAWKEDCKWQKIDGQTNGKSGNN